jgi:radical SAM/Cys-rich protein
MRDTRPLLLETDFPAVYRHGLHTLQVNLGYVCNLSCAHCHVNAGPHRTESMEEETASLVLRLLQRGGISILDLTGGAPELNPHFRYLVEQARQLGIAVIDRCNLTILLEPGQEGLAEFLAANEVEIVASLPCYLEENVNRQRGKGVFADSIDALRQLNALGYGMSDSRRRLNLVYNPQGPSLPPPQAALEDDYRRILADQHGIRFDHLLALANLPIQRFGSTLLSHGQFDDYVGLLKQSHRDANLADVMCRSLVSVDWQGYLYDCDFNQMLGLQLQTAADDRPHLRDLPGLALHDNPITVADHCYGCTAGQGSSCGGALQDQA